MRRIIILLVTALISVLSLSAAEVSFHVPSDTILTYCDESFVPDGDGVITLNLYEDNTATIQTGNGKEISVTFINTQEALVKWSLSFPEDISLRYSLNGSKPKSLKKGKTELNLSNLPNGELTIFTLEAKQGNSEWYECGSAGIIPVLYDPGEETSTVVLEGDEGEPEISSSVNRERKYSIRLTASPYSIGIYDFYNGHSIPDARYLTITNYGLSADAELGYHSGSSIFMYAGAGYGYQMKKETIIPYAFMVSYVKAYAGFDLKFLSAGQFSSSFGVFAGGMIGINAGVYNISSILGGRIRLDYRITDGLSLGLQTRFTASYLPAKDPLYRSMTYLIDPVTLSLDMRF